ncbi:F-box/LRR-repeat protein At3g48880-like [Zingiber officinale]|uniref:F-box/LRR-repeat protein At3g48880-like n=1 Tax=Zingiber officinale TaxID=94328 RepID=UPI001C4D7D18|nr:F-box/LRR-repeat protein At3g48880-like [Zingiber officinale]
MPPKTLRFKDNHSPLSISILISLFHFRRLALGDLAVAVPFVCKSWYRASLDPSCWRRLNFRSLGFTPCSPFSRAFALRYCLHSPLSFSAFLRFTLHRSRGIVDQLAFPLSSAVSIHDLAYASVKCLRLKALALPDNLMLEDDLRIPELVRWWKDLEHLEMEIVGIFAPPILSSSRSCNLSFAIPISLPKPLSFATSSLPRLHSPPSRNPGPFRAQVSVSAAQKTKDRLPANLIVTETKGPHSTVCTFPFSTF